VSRKPIIAGNWKMHKDLDEAREMVSRLVPLVAGISSVEVVVCPPFISLAAVTSIIADTNIECGAQDVFWESEGAYTGEISPEMVKSTGCSYCIVGHSERRHYFKETDEDVNRKAKALLSVGITPIICLGETLEQRKQGMTEAVVTSSVRGGLAGISAEQAEGIVVAYEPVWAIGTGENATGEEANRVIGLIRETIAGLYSSETADAVRIQYGGSVKPANIWEFMQESEIDGALVGGASLDPESFAQIVKYE